MVEAQTKKLTRINPHIVIYNVDLARARARAKGEALVNVVITKK